MAQRSDRLDGAAMLLMVALCALWGMNQVSIKVANTGISPVFQAGLRSAAAAGLLWAWARWRGIALFARDGTLGMGLLTAVLFAGEFTFLYWSLEFTNASRAVIFLYLSPFVVAIGGHLTIPGERLRFSHGLGLISAFIGMTIAFADALRLPTHRELLGDAIALTAAVFWGVTTVVVKASRLARASPHKVLFYQLAGSAVICERWRRCWASAASSRRRGWWSRRSSIRRWSSPSSAISRGSGSSRAIPRSSYRRSRS